MLVRKLLQYFDFLMAFLGAKMVKNMPSNFTDICDDASMVFMKRVAFFGLFVVFFSCFALLTWLAYKHFLLVNFMSGAPSMLFFVRSVALGLAAMIFLNFSVECFDCFFNHYEKLLETVSEMKSHDPSLDTRVEQSSSQKGGQPDSTGPDHKEIPKNFFYRKFSILIFLYASVIIQIALSSS